MTQTTEPIQPDHLVLVGGGHSHVQVLKAFAMNPLPNSRLSLVVDRPISVYSGMVPGFVAGQYQARQLEIDARPLARLARADVIVAKAIGVDPRNRRILLDGRPSVAYDVASFDIGSTVAGLETPGIRQYAIPTRPIGRFVEKMDRVLSSSISRSSLRAVVVGGGAGGVELAFTLQQRLATRVSEVEVTLVQGGKSILPGSPSSLINRTLQTAQDRGLKILTGSRVSKATEQQLHLENGSTLEFDLLLWVTGAQSHDLFRKSDVATDSGGFVSVRPTLQLNNWDNLFAVGDCASLMEYPNTPKAGVYAVRQGPVLTENLRRLFAGQPLKSYRPQSDFLALLNLGDGTALGTKWGLSTGGQWVMNLKDRIDRDFMDKFQVLDNQGALTENFAFAKPMIQAMQTLVCGGCAAKLDPRSLDRLLDRLEEEDSTTVTSSSPPRDDAAIYRTASGALRATSLDALTPMMTDPWILGRIAALGALSDLWVKGAIPDRALAFAAIPHHWSTLRSEEYLYQMLSGARREFSAAGTSLLGGHTSLAESVVLGFQVDGFFPADQKPLTLDRVKSGQDLILTKPLGLGVLLRADMLGLAKGPWIEAALSSMLQSGAESMQIAVAQGVTAATDITGFGLGRHLMDLLEASQLGATLQLEALPVLDGALEALAQGIRSSAHAPNESEFAFSFDGDAAQSDRLPLLFDPQTAGAFLLAVQPEKSHGILDQLPPGAALIGRTVDSPGLIVQ